MKRWSLVGTSVLGLAVWSWVMVAPALSQGRGQGFRPCPYTSYLCPVRHTCKPFDASGKVAQVLTENLADSMRPGMAVVVDTKTQGRVHVHLGPVWYLERQEFAFNPGDEVRVKGMCEKEKGGMMQVTAYELSKGNYLLSLRDSQGRPNWEAWRKMGN
jgi:hypothetical protein